MHLNKEEIKKIIPHREPMLWVDEVIEMVPGESIIARLTIAPDLDLFLGHFPGNPVLPGVLSVEAIAQVADILLLSLPRYNGTTPYFIGIDEVRFKNKILPGDTVEIKASIKKEIPEKGIVTCEGEIRNGDLIAVVGLVTLAMR